MAGVETLGSRGARPGVLLLKVALSAGAVALVFSCEVLTRDPTWLLR